MKNIFNNTNLSPLELAKCIKNIKTATESKKEFEELKTSILSEEKLKRVNQILSGFEQEDEFAILCRLMKTSSVLVKLEQNKIIDNDNEIIPDFLGIFSPGCSVAGKSRKKLNLNFKCFIEVKSVNKNVFKISKKDLDRRNNFAKKFNLPLIFAIRFMKFGNNALWIMVDSKYLSKNGRKIEATELNKSLRHILLDDYFLFALPNLHILHYYDPTDKKNGIQSKEHGKLLKTYILLSDKQIEIEEKDVLFFNVLVDAFELMDVKTQSDGHIVAQISRLKIPLISIVDILYKVNRLVADEDGNPAYDAAKILSRLDTPDKNLTLLNRDHIEYIVNKYNKKVELFFNIAFEDPKEHLSKLTKMSK